MTRFKFEPSDEVLAQLPRKPVRADGLATYQKLLETVEEIYSSNADTSLSLKLVSELSGVPVALVYHFFPVPEAALAALTEVYVERAALEVMLGLGVETDQNWEQVVNAILAAGRLFYTKYPAAGKLRLGPHQSASVRHLLLESNWSLAQLIELELKRLFKLPPILDLVDDLAYAIVMSDALWSLSYSLHGTVTDKFAAEAERAVTSFLIPVLGVRLSRHNTAKRQST